MVLLCQVDVHKDHKSLDSIQWDECCPLQLAQFAQAYAIPSFIPDWASIEAMALPLRSTASTRGEAEPPYGLALILHLHEPEAWFHARPNRFDDLTFRTVVLTTTSSEKAAQIELALSNGSFGFSCEDTHVLVCPNRGRDVAPFWRSLRLIGSCEVFLKLHQKRSPQWDGFLGQNQRELPGQLWTDHCLGCLLPRSDQELEDILALFRRKPIGCIFPRPWPFVEKFGWNVMENFLACNRVCKQLQLPEFVPWHPLVFPAGNMFYGLTSIFLPFRDFFGNLNLYPEEPLLSDGTMAHAVERISSAICASHRLGVASLFGPERDANPVGPSTLGGSFGDRRYHFFMPELLHPDGPDLASHSGSVVAQQVLESLDRESQRQLMVQTELAQMAYQPLWRIGWQRLKRRLLSN